MIVSRQSHAAADHRPYEVRELLDHALHTLYYTCRQVKKMIRLCPGSYHYLHIVGDRFA